jgi:hypothetical protein
MVNYYDSNRKWVRWGYQGWTFQNSDFWWCPECNLSSWFAQTSFGGSQFDGAGKVVIIVYILQ